MNMKNAIPANVEIVEIEMQKRLRIVSFWKSFSFLNLGIFVL